VSIPSTKEQAVHTTTSADGTRIAYESSGSGPAVVLVGGAFSYRRFPKTVQLAELLSDRYTVFNYDRRGRGDSGDADAYGVDGARRTPPADFAERLDVRLAAGDRGGAVRLYMTQAMGAPSFFVRAMRLLPVWSRLEAVAHTLPYDWAVLGDAVSGRPLDLGLWGRVQVPALVMAGSKSPALLREAAEAIAGVLPAGEHRVLEGQSHNPSMKVQAPVVAEYFGAAQRATVAV
jgi:pimeloyl-ACP methyl ester carboxylesterase